MGRPRRPRRALRKRGLIVTEGQITEKTYLDLLVAHLREQAAIVETKRVPVGGEPSKVLAKARGLRGEAERTGEPFDWCCCVVDVDEHTTLERVLIEARHDGIGVVITNPKFELWLLWHFEDRTSHVDGKTLAGLLNGKRGVAGKHLTHEFPVDHYADACARARRADAGLAPHRAGTNPSSALPWLVDLITSPA